MAIHEFSWRLAHDRAGPPLAASRMQQRPRRARVRIRTKEKEKERDGKEEKTKDAFRRRKGGRGGGGSNLSCRLFIYFIRGPANGIGPHLYSSRLVSSPLVPFPSPTRANSRSIDRSVGRSRMGGATQRPPSNWPLYALNNVFLG